MLDGLALTTRNQLSVSWGPSLWSQPALRAVAAEVGLSEGAFLDLGARDGWLCIHVASGHSELDSVGLVRTEDEKQRADWNRGSRLNCTFKVVSPAQLTYPADTFHGAAAVACVQDWDEPQQVLDEVYRVLVPGSRLLIYDPVASAEIPSDWVQRRGVWPPTSVVRRYLAKRGLSDGQWAQLKDAVRASAFGGGQEGQHGYYRRLVLTKEA